jgi:hypothetical protein
MTKRDYPVGYGKPPKNTQFKKGQSGNPRGRPKGSRNMLTILDDDLAVQITATVNGRTKWMSKAEGIVKQLTRAALHGDLRAIIALFRILLDREYRRIMQEAARPNAEATVLPPDLSLLTPDELLILSDLAGEVEQRKHARAADQRDESGSEDDPGDPGKPDLKSMK